MGRIFEVRPRLFSKPWEVSCVGAFVFKKVAWLPPGALALNRTHPGRPWRVTRVNELALLKMERFLSQVKRSDPVQLAACWMTRLWDVTTLFFFNIVWNDPFFGWSCAFLRLHQVSHSLQNGCGDSSAGKLFVLVQGMQGNMPQIKVVLCHVLLVWWILHFLCILTLILTFNSHMPKSLRKEICWLGGAIQDAQNVCYPATSQFLRKFLQSQLEYVRNRWMVWLNFIFFVCVCVARQIVDKKKHKMLFLARLALLRWICAVQCRLFAAAVSNETCNEIVLQPWSWASKLRYVFCHHFVFKSVFF